MTRLAAGTRCQRPNFPLRPQPAYGADGDDAFSSAAQHRPHGTLRHRAYSAPCQTRLRQVALGTRPHCPHSPEIDLLAACASARVGDHCGGYRRQVHRTRLFAVHHRGRRGRRSGWVRSVFSCSSVMGSTGSVIRCNSQCLEVSRQTPRRQS